MERRRLKDLREEVGTKVCIVGKIVRAGNRGGGSQLRREDCVKGDLRKAEEEEKWRQQANNKEQWKNITTVVIQRSDE